MMIVFLYVKCRKGLVMHRNDIESAKRSIKFKCSKIILARINITYICEHLCFDTKYSKNYTLYHER